MAECCIRTLPAPAIALVMARKGQAGTAAAAAVHAFGAALPALPRIAYGEDVALVWCGPERWLVLAEEARAAAAGGIEAMLEPVFAGSASVTDQSGSRVLLDVAGKRGRALRACTAAKPCDRLWALVGRDCCRRGGCPGLSSAP